MHAYEDPGTDELKQLVKASKIVSLHVIYDRYVSYMRRFKHADRARRPVRTGCCFFRKEAQASGASCRGIEAHRAR